MFSFKFSISFWILAAFSSSSSSGTSSAGFVSELLLFSSDYSFVSSSLLGFEGAVATFLTATAGVLVGFSLSSSSAVSSSPANYLCEYYGFWDNVKTVVSFY